jgi:hypothetical protein
MCSVKKLTARDVKCVPVTFHTASGDQWTRMIPRFNVEGQVREVVWNGSWSKYGNLREWEPVVRVEVTE